MTKREEDFKKSLNRSFETALQDARSNDCLYSPLVMAGILYLIKEDYEDLLADKYGPAGGFQA